MKYFAIALLSLGAMSLAAAYLGLIKGEIKYDPQKTFTGPQARMIGIIALILGLVLLAAGGVVMANVLQLA